MFTFQVDSNILKKPTNKLQPIPQLTQPQKLQPLPALPFYLQATDPLPFHSNTNTKQKQYETFEMQIHRYEQQYSELSLKYSRLEEDYGKIKRDYEELRGRYREGQVMFGQLEADNMRLYNQVESLRNRRQERSKIQIKKKQIPVVKISVPNPKNFSHQSQKQSMYRQLKTASDELAYVKKLLQSQKQKSEHNSNFLTKSVEKLTNQKQTLKSQINLIKEQNKQLKQENIKSKNAQIQGYSSTRTLKISQPNQLQKLKVQYQRLQKMHRSCDVLLASRETQISALRIQIQRLNQLTKYLQQNQNSFHRTGSRRNLIQQKQTNIKQSFQTHTLFPSSSEKKVSDLYQINQQNNNILQQHLDLSVKQMKSIQQFIKTLVSEFIAKIDSLKNQLQWANQKVQYQKDQLEKVYQILKNKKGQLENCYKQMRNLGNRGTPVKQANNEDQLLKSILKGRRNIASS